MNRQYTLEERLKLEEGHKFKIYLGVYIHSDRRKRPMGKIKTNELPNKIEVYQKDMRQTLHQSIVYWAEVRRYSRVKKTEKEKPKYIEKIQQTKQQNLKEQQGSRGQKQEIKNQDSKDQGQSESQQEEQQRQQLETIVARIVYIKQNMYKDSLKIIVCTLSLDLRLVPLKCYKDSTPLEIIDSDHFIDAFPINRRLPKFQLNDIFEIQKDIMKLVTAKKQRDKINQVMEILRSHYFTIRYKFWKNQRYPTGVIVNRLKKIKTPEGQCDAFLHQFGLNNYDQNQIVKLEPIPLQITPLHNKYEGLVFTIDPKTSVDLDDALSIETTPNNTYLVGIHIADVSSYLHLLDRKELSKLSTSVYLPHRVLHMLPKEFVQICTLKPMAERLSFTVFLELNQKGEVLSQKYQKLIIRSRCQLSYEIAQEIIEDKIKGYSDFPEHMHFQKDEAEQLITKIKLLNMIAKNRRANRIEVDVFKKNEIYFQLDQNNYPIQVSLKVRKQAHKMIEQFMILANEAVAKKLVKNFGQDTLIIHHPPPSCLNLQYFNKSFQEYDAAFDFKDMHEFGKQIKLFLQKDISQEVKKLLILKATRVQEMATYKRNQVEKKGHFALNLESYTHFTSPMRRFADIIVHQQLLKCLEGKSNTEEERKRLQCEILILNSTRQATKKLKQRIIDSFFCLYIEHKALAISTKAIIASFGISSVSIFIPEFDLVKQIMWREQMKVRKVTYQKDDKNILNVEFYQNNKRYVWKAKKYTSVDVLIDCTYYCPLEMGFHFLVEIDSKIRKIKYQLE